MNPDKPAIVIIEDHIKHSELERMVSAYFGDMVKLVIDTKRQIVAVGGELHADAEHLLLEQGSEQTDLWGANYYPGRGEESYLEYTALMNIRPSQGNHSMEIQDEATRTVVRQLVERLVGKGENL